MQKQYYTPALRIFVMENADVITNSAVLDDSTLTKDHVIVGGWSDSWQ